MVPFEHLAQGYPVIERVNERFNLGLHEVSTDGGVRRGGGRASLDLPSGARSPGPRPRGQDLGEPSRTGDGHGSPMMRALRQLDGEASSSLQMENELLSHETRHLRARLAQAERRLKRAREQADRLPEREAKITSLRERLDDERKLPQVRGTHAQAEGPAADPGGGGGGRPPVAARAPPAFPRRPLPAAAARLPDPARHLRRDQGVSGTAGPEVPLLVGARAVWGGRWSPEVPGALDGWNCDHFALREVLAQAAELVVLDALSFPWDVLRDNDRVPCPWSSVFPHTSP